MSGYRIVKATRCEEARRRMIDHMVEQIKKAMSHHDTVIFSLITLSGDAKMIEECLREKMPDMEFTVDVGVGVGNAATELIISGKRKNIFPH
jgi:predicted metal-binding protein